jgi:serine protease Do
MALTVAPDRRQRRALGVVTATAIRGTTVVIPSALAWAIGQQIVAQGGTKQGYLGISSSSVKLPAAQRGDRQQSDGLLVNGVVDGSPAAAAGVLVGDVILAFDAKVVDDPETLLTMLRGDRIPRQVTLTVSRGGETRQITVTVGERERR